MADIKLRKLPRQARSRSIFESILDATARILVREGYGRTNTNRIAEEAGVSVGSLYQYFPNRETIVAAVVERHGRRVHRIITEASGPEQPLSLDNAVHRIVGAVVTAHRIDPKLHAILESEMPHMAVVDGHTQTVRAIREQLLGIAPAVRRDMAVEDLETASMVVGEITHALVHAALIHPRNPLPPADVERETVRAVLAYLQSPVRTMDSG